MATKKKTPAKARGAAKAPARGPSKRPAAAAKGPARKSPARSGPARAGGPRGASRSANPDRKLPRKHGARRKTPRSIGREAAPPAPRVSTAPDESRPLAVALAKAALDKKAEQITVFDVRGLSSYADYLVIMSTESDRQAAAVADHVDATLEAAGHNKVAVEGYETGTWIIVDYGDVVAHVMSKASREFYDLDGLWADAPRFTVED